MLILSSGMCYKEFCHAVILLKLCNAYVLREYLDISVHKVLGPNVNSFSESNKYCM